jgi:hypothetical protein
MAADSGAISVISRGLPGFRELCNPSISLLRRDRVFFRCGPEAWHAVCELKVGATNALTAVFEKLSDSSQEDFADEEAPGEVSTVQAAISQD